jgi:hypothetical protein
MVRRRTENGLRSLKELLGVRVQEASKKGRGCENVEREGNKAVRGSLRLWVVQIVKLCSAFSTSSCFSFLVPVRVTPSYPLTTRLLLAYRPSLLLVSAVTILTFYVFWYTIHFNIKVADEFVIKLLGNWWMCMSHLSRAFCNSFFLCSTYSARLIFSMAQRQVKWSAECIQKVSKYLYCLLNLQNSSKWDSPCSVHNPQ